MNRILIAIAILLGSYLVYTNFVVTDDETLVVVTQEPKVNSRDDDETADLETDMDSVKDIIKINNFVTGTYSGNLDSDDIKASLTITLKPDGTFVHTRSMTVPEILSGEISGEYTVDGNVITAKFPVIKDAEVFKAQQAIFNIEPDGSLVTGNYILTLRE